MKLQFINSSFRNSAVWIFLLCFPWKGFSQELTNYVNNPSFENVVISASISPTQGLINWSAIDTTKGAFILFTTGPPFFNAPNANFGFQFPRNGSNYIITTFYRTNQGLIWYPRTRLKQTLKPNTTYCTKYYVVNTNNNRIAIDSYGMYFGNSSLDTITHYTVPLTYLSPQIQNTTGIITDTLNWIPISGTFTALGDEKYLVLGNFINPAQTNTLLINTPTLSFMTNDVYIDDVSVIEMDLPAYAGPDKNVIVGDSVYIGRESDIEIDESCIWYQMTSPTSSVTIDTLAGLYVKPVVTTTYVVRQQLWCSGVKWDTVVVFMDYVGLKNLNLLNQELRIYPVPAQDYFELKISNQELFKDFKTLLLYNNLGQLIREEEINFKDKAAVFSTIELSDGVYSLELIGEDSFSIRKRFVISH